MTRYKVDELPLNLLDYAVATLERAAAMEVKMVDGACVMSDGMVYRHYLPTVDWNIAGPIIQRENIQLTPPTVRVHRNGGPHAGWGMSGVWGATTWHAGANGRRAIAYHESCPLVAAMRCYVSSKLGDELDLPDDVRQA